MHSHLFEELAEMQRESSYSDEWDNYYAAQPESQREISAMFAEVA
jgi:hypothetical protein